ncbi:hypothetical protein KKH3_26480 [Pectobacterium actinidiae]|nr:hypothetical protein KKH3_26480 [Pectobacterium actinidiae]
MARILRPCVPERCRESEPSGDTKTKITPLTEKKHDHFPAYPD